MYKEEERIRKKSATIGLDPLRLMYIVKIQRMWRSKLRLKQLRQLIARKRNKELILKELVDSQRTYCANLERIVTQVVIPSKEVIEDEQLHGLLFCNLEDIYVMHAAFMAQLEAVMKEYKHHQTKISTLIFNELFNKNDFMNKYSQYCANYRKSNKISKVLVANNTGLRAILQKLNLADSTYLDSELIKPMQRLCKYELILSKIHKNMERDHCDYDSMEEVIQFVEKMVRETNDQVEEFLLGEKFREVMYQHEKAVFEKFPNPQRKLVYSLEDVSLIDLINDTSTVAKEINLFNDCILVVFANSKPILATLRIARDLPNLKYFKNLTQLINEERYLTISFKKEKQKDQFTQALAKTQIHEKGNEFVTVSMRGTESRESVFKNYTVYIAEITFGEQVKTIYSRFKDMLRIEEILHKKKIKVSLPSLNKETLFATNKSKTIEKRKLIIQEFLERMLNCAECYNVPEIFKVLNLSLNEKNKRNDAEISILLPSLQVVKVMVDVKSANISDLKEAVAMNLGLIHHSQFEIFQQRGKDQRRVMHDDEPVLPIYEEQSGFSFNLFKESTSYVYTRHHYLSAEEEFALFKDDFIRIELELSVIKAEIRQYRLEEELMITFMCLFAMYINLPIHDETKLTSFIKDIGKKTYKISSADFRAYYKEVEKRVEAEENELVTLPFLIIKIISNCSLYRCQQFDVQVHPKSFKAVKSYVPGLEQKISLGIKNTHLLLLTPEAKHTMLSIPIYSVEIEVHPNALLLQIENIGPVLRLNTPNGYEIQKLIRIYKDMN